ncbi:hypothetical protein RUM43_005650 [Polyplax serrata]|uniref:Uncharacterized protein n=1 Tax=Polyplax serrata TaxID=468196 RepID=A0AAN8NRL4_POLSC
MTIGMRDGGKQDGSEMTRLPRFNKNNSGTPKLNSSHRGSTNHPASDEDYITNITTTLQILLQIYRNLLSIKLRVILLNVSFPPKNVVSQRAGSSGSDVTRFHPSDAHKSNSFGNLKQFCLVSSTGRLSTRPDFDENLRSTQTSIVLRRALPFLFQSISCTDYVACGLCIPIFTSLQVRVPGPVTSSEFNLRVLVMRMLRYPSYKRGIGHAPNPPTTGASRAVCVLPHRVDSKMASTTKTKSVPSRWHRQKNQIKKGV